jgi:hypothetical protein
VNTGKSFQKMFVKSKGNQKLANFEDSKEFIRSPSQGLLIKVIFSFVGIL